MKIVRAFMQQFIGVRTSKPLTVTYFASATKKNPRISWNSCFKTVLGRFKRRSSHAPNLM